MGRSSRPQRRAPAMLRIANLDVSIGPVVIIRGASLRLEAGEMCGLIGAQRRRQDHAHARADGRAAVKRHGRACGRRSSPPSGPSPRCPRHWLYAGGPAPGPRIHRRAEHPAAELGGKTPGVEERLDWIFSIMPEVARFAPAARSNCRAASRRWWRWRARSSPPPLASARRAVRGACAGARAPASAESWAISTRDRFRCCVGIERNARRRSPGARLPHRAGSMTPA